MTFHLYNLILIRDLWRLIATSEGFTRQENIKLLANLMIDFIADVIGEITAQDLVFLRNRLLQQYRFVLFVPFIGALSWRRSNPGGDANRVYLP